MSHNPKNKHLPIGCLSACCVFLTWSVLREWNDCRASAWHIRPEQGLKISKIDSIVPKRERYSCKPHCNCIAFRYLAKEHFNAPVVISCPHFCLQMWTLYDQVLLGDLCRLAYLVSTTVVFLIKRWISWTKDWNPKVITELIPRLQWVEAKSTPWSGTLKLSVSTR